MTLRDLTLRLRTLVSPRRAERDLREELEFHIARETARYVGNGMSATDARNRAIARFGSVALAADACRDARGTRFIDETVRDVGYAFRTFRRSPLSALTIVTTVALGLGLVAAVFSVLNVLLFRVDEVPNVGELFAVERPSAADGERVLTRIDYEAIRRETSVFGDTVAMLPDIDSRIDGRMMSGSLVTGNFFRVLGVDAARGRPLLPEDDERGGQAVVVLSHRGWSRIFASDPAVIGRQLTVNGFAYDVVGVMPEGFRGLGVSAPDYWAPLTRLGQFRRIHLGHEDAVGLDIVGRLKPGLSRETALAGLLVWDSARVGRTPADRPAATLTLEPRRGTLPQPAEAMLVFTPLFFAFGLILMIGCANVANLMLARGVARQREIGMRLSLGASRRRIVRQLLTESLVLALAAAALGFAVSRVVLEATVTGVMSSMAQDLAENVRVPVPGADWRVVLFLVVGAVVATVFFGLAPALQVTRLELVRTIRGEVTRDARQGRARNALIAVQATASALLLICAVVFLRSAFASSTIDPGLQTADTVIIEMANEDMRERMIHAVGADPVIASVAASWPDTLSRPRIAFARSSAPDSSSPDGRVAYRFVSPEYFAVLGIEILRGRGFTSAERSAASAVAVISESVARQLWPGGDALGQVLRLEPDRRVDPKREDEPPLSAGAFTIVGISRDVAGFRIADFKEANVYVPIGAEQAKTSLTARVNGDPDQARRALLRRLTVIDPDMGQIVTMRTLARMETYFLQIAFSVTVALGGFALVLTVSGLFSVLTYLVEQRRREIGVRMALGATTRSVGRLVLLQSIKPVAAGLVAGSGLAVALGVVLVATPAASGIAAIVHVLDPVAYIASALCIATACALAALVPAVRAARIDPIATLRQD
jgi:predicted permease